jgi:isoquinoline 1-oxidoreductase alpha subunit
VVILLPGNLCCKAINYFLVKINPTKVRSLSQGKGLNIKTPRRAFMADLNVNGKKYKVDVDPETPLLWVIRDHVGLTGTKYGCGVGQCGACTVLFDGQAIRSCAIPVSAAEGKKIETIESLEKNGQLSKVQKAWVDNQVPQCGYCQSGMVMATTALLRNTPKPTDAQIDAAVSNICRCGTFQQVRDAIHAVSKA